MASLLNSLGTYGIVRRLLRHSDQPSLHPMLRYRRGQLELPFPILGQWLTVLHRRRGWLWVGLVLVGLAMVAQLLLRAQWRGFITTTCAFAMLLPVIIAVASLYLLPAVVAVLTSATIVAERELQTWDILLSTALDWHDLLLAWLARLLRLVNPFRELLPGVYVLLGGLACLFAIVTFANEYSGVLGEVLEWVVVFLVPLQYLVERVQDFVLASVIGLLASLLSPSRQVAAAVALCAMLGWLILRGLFTAALIGLLPTQTPSSAAILLLTGPASALAMSLPVLPALVLLLLLPLINEIVIRWLFAWLVKHLGEGRTLTSA
jgi:hypothetical protein